VSLPVLNCLFCQHQWAIPLKKHTHPMTQVFINCLKLPGIFWLAPQEMQKIINFSGKLLLFIKIHQKFGKKGSGNLSLKCLTLWKSLLNSLEHGNKNGCGNIRPWVGMVY